MGDYFVWETRRLDSQALIAAFPPTKRDYGISFFVGRRILVAIPELEVVIDRENSGALTDDLVVAKHRCVAHSPLLRKVLHDVGVHSIDYYPLRIVDPVSGRIYRSHEAANILDVIFCLDREGSNLSIDDEDPTNIWYINRLALVGERLGDALLFRLGERPWTVIVHRQVKEAVERAGVTGALFLPAEGYREYHGFAFNNPRNVIGTHDDDPDGPADGTKRNVPGVGESGEQRDLTDERN